jgi:hypothetical protein
MFVNDIDVGRGLLFSPVTVSNVSFTGTLADSGYTITPGGVSNFGVQLFQSGQLNEGTSAMRLTQGVDAIVDPGEQTIGWGNASPFGDGTLASHLRMETNFGAYQDPPVTDPLLASSAFPRQSGPFTILTTQNASMIRGLTLGYDVTYNISPAGPTADADFDGDDDVDGADFLIWQRGVGTAGGQPQGNADGVGNIDGADLAIWKSQFASATVAATSVPEPTSAFMALAAGIGAAATRRGRRRG